MAKYHVNAEGNPGACKAKVQCPFGGAEAHYASKDDARAAYEQAQANPKPKKTYPAFGEERSMEIARTIKGQVQPVTFMCLGASEFMAMDGGLRFRARILGFNAAGQRGGVKKMYVEVRLNGLDYYDVKVSYVKGFDAFTHFEQEDVDAASLDTLLYRLDYAGETALNPNY